MVYTSYFGNLSGIPNSIQRVSIAHSTPVLPRVTVIKEARLAPDWQDVLGFKYGSMSENVFSMKYMSYLEKNKELVREILLGIQAAFPDSVLLCYEKPGVFCHRHLLASFAVDRLGIQVEEWAGRG